MSENTYAVLIGINEYQDTENFTSLRYAQKDCEDMFNAITHSSYGKFKKENATIILGEQATTQNVQEALYKSVVKDRTSDDTVLVYFSGHGFLAGDRGLAYLGTYDVQIKNIVRNPSAGLRMQDVFEDYFAISPARSVIFILDCCHSGALTPTSIKGISDSETRGLIDQKAFMNSIGRIALVACPPNAVSRESSDLENGIFTHYLLRGLRGEATEFNTGEVTLDSLMSFVRIHAPSEQPPGSYGQSYMRIVLSAPGVREEINSKPQISNISFSTPITPQVMLNPLETLVPVIEKLMLFLSEPVPDSTLIDKHILNSIKNLLEADCAFVLRPSDTGKQREWFVKSYSDLAPGTEDFMTIGVPRAISALTNAVENRLKFEDLYFPYSVNNGETKSIIVVPVHLEKSNDYIVVSGINKLFSEITDPYIRLISAVYLATRELTVIQPTIVEAAIYDALKNHYGHLPLKMYERRFELFANRLNTMTVYFEPMLHLDPGNLYISGWEALARDPLSLTAPGDLFYAAELWGRKFITELDVYFINKALTGYRQVLTEAKRQRADEIQPLSVNVYPSTLMRTVYKQEVRQALNESHILAEKLILEISEKVPIPDEAETIEGFKRKLIEDYIRGLQIGGFAIDDFGVGHSSVSRLARLDPEHVKIDRDVLQHGFTEITLKFVQEVTTQNRLRRPKIVVEGFDTSSSVNLNQLYRFGIRYVQGHLIGKASAKLYRLEREMIQFLENLLKQD